MMMLITTEDTTTTTTATAAAAAAAAATATATATATTTTTTTTNKIMDISMHFPLSSIFNTPCIFGSTMPLGHLLFSHQVEPAGSEISESHRVTGSQDSDGFWTNFPWMSLDDLYDET